MDRDTSAKKILFFLLDMILIMGAVVGIMTIDGGKWLINNPAFYQAPEGEIQESAVVPASLPLAIPSELPAVIPVTGADGSRETIEAAAPRKGGGCSMGAHAAGQGY